MHLVRVYPFHFLGSPGVIDYICMKKRLESDYKDVQADQTLSCLHTFAHSTKHIFTEATHYLNCPSIVHYCYTHANDGFDVIKSVTLLLYFICSCYHSHRISSKYSGMSHTALVVLSGNVGRLLSVYEVALCLNPTGLRTAKTL